ncbi:MAG: hypothetical protein VX328_01685, partial [Candidatus Thermoplasmatota archaeon]|nr:hypothetical protein [Candidatus Thermoplasmatota archaeon]
EQKLIRALRKFLLGGEPKKSHMNKLLGLPEICLPVQELDDYLQKISTDSSVVVDDKYAEGIEKISSVLERIGIGLAPLDEDMAEIAHRAIAGHIYRMETCLAMLAKLNCNMMTARLHLSRALHHATLIDDVKSEMLATDQLGLLALARNKWSRAAELFEIAERQAQAIKASRLRYVVCAGMARYLSDEKELATKHLTSAQGLVQENLGRAGTELLMLGEGLMAMDEVGLAIEVLDEGMECAIEAKETELTERLAEYLVLANNALTDSDAEQYLGLRQYLDDINTVGQTIAEEFDERISDIEQQAEIMSQPIEAPDGWVDAETVFPTSTKFTVLRQILTGDKEVLIIGQHSDLGIIGFWLPDSEHNVSAGQNITIAQTQVKVADAPSELRSEHNLSSLVAIKDCSKISFSAEINM